MVVAEDKSIAAVQYPMRLQDRIERVEKEILADAVARFSSTRKMAQNLGTSQSSVMRKMKKYSLNQYNLNRK
jgi:TyrR family helix-turn-helix protein